MFSQLQAGNRKRLQRALAASLIAHCVFVAVLVRRPAPRFVSPSFLMAGNGGRAYQTIYLGGKGQSEEDSVVTRQAPVKPAPKPPVVQKHLTLPSPEPEQKQEVASA